MNVKLFIAVFVSVLTVIGLIPLLWWFAGLPGLRWLIAGSIISMGAILTAAPPAAILAAKKAIEEYESKPLVVELNPLWGELDFAVHRVDRDTIAQTEMTWGDFEEPSGTKVPAHICVSWDSEANRALGSWWASASPREMVGLRYKVHETYDGLEREAAEKVHTEATMRSGMRRGVSRHQRDVMDAYDSETLPNGEEFADVFAEIEKEYHEDHNEDPRDDPAASRQPEDQERDQQPTETEGGALPAADDADVSAAVPDGGSDG